MSHQNEPRIPLPKSRNKHVRSAVFHVISLAQFAVIYTRGWEADSINPHLRRKSQLLRVNALVAQLQEELQVKDARMARTPPHRRPQYTPVERMAILELRAARGWSIQQTAKAFSVTDATVRSWMKRINEEGPDSLVQLRDPVNRFPDLVRYTVQRLKVLCPSLGKVKIAQILTRAGLHLGATTIGRILKESPAPKPKAQEPVKGRVVTAREPGHVWHVDLTAVPIDGGFWTSWLPFALPQKWPHCWWCAVVVDHYSRRIMKIGFFADNPDCRAVCAMLGQAIRKAGGAPKYIICDKGSIFDNDAFRSWVKSNDIKPPRYGAIGEHGSIAVVERLILTLKNECTRKIIVPLRRVEFRRELDWFTLWYNAHRPHMTLGGRTPDEVYFRLNPANQRPRIEPRGPSPCAKPRTLVAGQAGDRFSLEISQLGKRQHLPVVTLTRAA